jgi:hypothetical protein
MKVTLFGGLARDTLKINDYETKMAYRKIIEKIIIAISGSLSKNIRRFHSGTDRPFSEVSGMIKIPSIFPNRFCSTNFNWSPLKSYCL